MVQETQVYFQVRNFIILKKYYDKISLIENFELNSRLNIQFTHELTEKLFK